jgi:hypothetical protein
VETLKWVLLGIGGAWLLYRALKRPPPTNRWQRFAQTHDLDLSPSTPFAQARISGLWRGGGSGAPIPIAIQIMRRTRTRAEGLVLSARVPGGLPKGLCLDFESIRHGVDLDRCQGMRSRDLACRIRDQGLDRPLLRFFEDWPGAVIAHGGVQLKLPGKIGDPLATVEALVELCRLLDSGEASPGDLVIAELPPEDPDHPGSLPSVTVDAEAQAFNTEPGPGLGLQDFTPFGSPFGLTAPDMAPPGEESSAEPLPLDAELWLTDLSEESCRQLKALATSTDAAEQRALLRQLETEPLSLEQAVESTHPTRDQFLPEQYSDGTSSIGPLIGLDMLARIRHPRGPLNDGPWAVQVVDWDPDTRCLLGHRLPHRTS